MTRAAGLLCALWLAACAEPDTPAHLRVAGGEPATGRAVIARLGCGACHVVPGVPGARGTVGPSLAGFAQRSFIGGVAPNRPAILIEWVRAAPEIARDTAMPPLPLTEQDARHVAAFLYTLR